MHNDDKACGNCKHWGIRFMTTVTVPDSGPLGAVSRQLAPCLCDAVEPDAGFGAVVLLGPESHCRCHADAWQPAADIDEPSGDGDDYGVRPGVDFPATLQRQRHAF